MSKTDLVIQNKEKIIQNALTWWNLPEHSCLSAEDGIKILMHIIILQSLLMLTYFLAETSITDGTDHKI